VRLTLKDRDAERACGNKHAFVEARQCDIILPSTQKFYRGEVQRIERANCDRKWLERSGETTPIELKQADAVEHCARHLLRVRGPSRVDSIPNFVFQQPAGDELFVPERGGHCSRLGKNLSEHDRAIKVNHGRRAPRQDLSKSLPMSWSGPACAAGVRREDWKLG